MARKSSKGKSDEYKWVAHIQVHFNDEEIREAQNWLSGKVQDVSESIDVITSNDTSVKITLDQHRASYQLTLQPKAKSSPYRGYTLGFSHTDLGRGMQILEYIHEVLMDAEGVDIPTQRTTNDW